MNHVISIDSPYVCAYVLCVIYSTHHRNVPVLESYNGHRTEETLQSVGRILTTSRRLHYRSKDVLFLRTVAPFSIKR